MAEQRIIPTRTSVSIQNTDIDIFNEYFVLELPFTIKSEIKETVGTQEGISHVEGELLITMIDGKYPSEIDYFVNADGTVTVKSESGDVDLYYIEDGNLFYGDQVLFTTLEDRTITGDNPVNLYIASNSFMVAGLESQTNIAKSTDGFDTVNVIPVQASVLGNKFRNIRAPIFSATNFLLPTLPSSNSTIITTDDGGSTYSQLQSPVSGVDLFDQTALGYNRNLNYDNLGTGFLLSRNATDDNLVIYTVDSAFTVNIIKTDVIYNSTNDNFYDVVNGTGYLFTPNGNYKTTDAGANWNLIASSGLPVSNLRDVQYDGVGTIYARSGTQFYKSINEGVNWTNIKSANTDFFALGIVILNGKLFLFEGNNTTRDVIFFVSEDDGNTFEQFNIENGNFDNMNVSSATYIGNNEVAIAGNINDNQLTENNLRIIDLTTLI